MKDETISTPVKGVKLKQSNAGEKPLGDLFFYSVPSDLFLKANDLKAIERKLNIPDAWRVHPIRETNAFIRATSGLRKESRDESVADGDEPILRAVLVRDAPRKPKFRHIVQEERIGLQKPTYTVLGHIYYNEKSVERPIGAQCQGSKEKELRSFLEMYELVKQEFAKAKVHYTDRDVRQVLQSALKELGTVSIRESGGIYFSPLISRNLLQVLKTYLEEVGCEVWVIPLSSASTDPKQIGSKLTAAITHEVASLQKQIDSAKDAPNGITRQRLSNLMGELGRLTRLRTQYKELLNLDLESSAVHLNEAGASAKSLVVRA